MKNITLFNQVNLLQSFCKRMATATTSCAHSYKRYYLLLTILLFVGVNNAWAGAGFYEVYMTYSYNGTNSSVTLKSDANHTDLGILTADFTITGLYLKYWKDNSGNICGGLMDYYIDSDKEYQPNWTWYYKGSGNDRELQSTSTFTVAKHNGNSGHYTFWYRFKTWGSSTSSSECNHDNYYLPSNSNNKNKFNYTIAPPAVKSFTVTPSGDIISGSGTQAAPYIIRYNGSLVLTLSGSQNHTDANSTIQYNTSGAWDTTKSRTISNVNSTEVKNVTVKARYKNNSDANLCGTESSKTIYYRSEQVYTVAFDANGHGAAPTEQKISEGGKVTAPTEPTAEGYIFGGWYKEPACINKWNFDTDIVNNDITLYAQWECALTEIKIEGTFAITQGGTISLRVADNPNITPQTTYLWKRGNEEVGNERTLTVSCELKNAGNYTCTVTNDHCSATNNFTVKYYHLKGFVEGDNNQDPDAWNTPHEFVWDGEGNKATLSIELKGHTTYQFKLNDGTSWYWNEGTITYNNRTDWVIEQQGYDTSDKQNTKITTTAPGIYTFTLNYDNAAKPKLSVIYPEEQIVYLKPGVWDVDGAEFTIYSWSSLEYTPSKFTQMELADCNGNVYKANIDPAHDWVSFIRAENYVENWDADIWDRSLDLKILNDPQFEILKWADLDETFGNNKKKSSGKWSAYIPYHTISYDMNGLGTQISDACIQGGNSWTAPPDPTEVGYTFLGWRRPAATGDNKLYKYDQGYKPTASEELTAQWQINQCTVTWKVNAEEEATTVVDIRNQLTTIPYIPTDDVLGCCAEKFIGWSTETNPSKNQVYTTAADLQNLIGTLTANTTKTFHAVFATPVPGAGTSHLTFSEMGYANEEAVTSVTLGDGLGNGDATITFAKGPAATYSPTYYTIGEAVRTYAGNTITVDATYASTTLTQIDLTFAKGENSNTITASTGTITDGIWTGNAQSVIFTIGGTTGHRRIASIAVTTEVTGDKYTNYVTKCDLSNSASIGAGTITYANSATAIDTKCGQRSPASKAATLTFASAQDLTCPVTIEATTGFLVSTNRNDNSKYASSIIVKPVKSGTNKGKLPTIYVRYEANFGVTGQIHGTITATGSEIDNTDVAVLANVTCTQYTLTVVDHLGNTINTTNYYEGNEVAEIAQPTPDDCSTNYTFDGWSTEEVEYGSLVYNKVSFPYTMPATDVTLYPVYRLVEDVSEADYHRVTSDLGADNWAGDYLIAASSTIVADGRTSNLTQINNANIDENIVPASFGNLYYVSLIAVDGGYVLKTQDPAKPYIYITDAAKTGTPTDELTKADDYPLTIKWDTKSNIIIHNAKNTTGYTFQYSASASPARFGFFKATSIYLYKKSSLYTTSLICGTIDIQESDIVVTSTKDQSVKVSVPVKLTSPYDDPVTVSGDNVKSFSVITKENVPVNTEEVVNVELVYSPQVYDQLETETITLTATNGANTSFQVTGRSLPEIFAIVAKVGNNWYALPSQGLNSETTPVGYPIEVDNNDNPTAVTSLPTKAEWELRNVYKVNGPNDRFAANGENLVFVNAENKTLYANNGNANIQTYAEYTNYAENNPDRYEWVPTTTDWTNYTLKNVGRNKDLSINVNATFGTHASNIASNNLRFLPINATYNPFDMQVVEWYPTKVLVQTEAALTSVSATVGGVAVASPVVTKKGGKLYEISSLPLENNPTKVLTISYDSYSCSKVIPIIISREKKTVTDAPFSTLTMSAYNYSDLVVRDGATLTINGTKQAPDKFVNVTIYPTAKIVVPENTRLNVYSLTFIGGITEVYDGSNYTLNKYAVPELSLKGNLGKTVTSMDYVMRVDLDQMYQMGVPYDVALSDITYGDGSPIELGTQLYVSAYDGQARANRESKTWVYETDFAIKFGSATLKAGVGYTISAEPQTNGDKYAILRLPMKSNISSGSTEAAKTVAVKAYDNQKGVTITDNHKGWNYLSNPYMTSISGGEADTKLVLGYLKETGTGPWEWVETTQRYVTIPMDNGKDYYQKKFSEAALKPFKSFFVQIATDGEMSFALTSRQNAPARYMEVQTEQEVEFEILLGNEKQADNTGLLIAEQYSPAYEINADLEKMTGSMSVYTIYGGHKLAYNALSPSEAKEWIPMGYIVPTTGEYTFELDEQAAVEDIVHIYLIDYETGAITDLLDNTYTFDTSVKKSESRFAINVVLRSDAPGTATGIDNMRWNSDQPQKFIYNGMMYILHNRTIYDANGQQVKTINK